MRIFGKGKCKLIANFSAILVTSLPSLSVCISLSLSHRKYLTHNIGSASALPIISLCCASASTTQSTHVQFCDDSVTNAHALIFVCLCHFQKVAKFIVGENLKLFTVQSKRDCKNSI